jgi:WD40 repeat protein
MKKILFLGFIVLFSFPAIAQKQASNWYFGVNAGISFASGSPVAISGSLNTPEGCSSMSSPMGNLMFYTDGINVWDKNHALMPNGTGLYGNSSSTQAANIVPNPANGAQFYIFTTDEFGGPNGFCYSIVDTTLNGGLGDVMVKNTHLLSNVTEKLSAVKNMQDNTYWIVVHEWGTNSFYSYHLTAAGLAPPVISSVGTVHTLAMPQNTYGQLKFSACGKRLAAAIGYQDIIELFDFDIDSGFVTHPITLQMQDHVYGVEFSPSLTYLYASCYAAGSTLVQFDITSDTAGTILASQVVLSLTPSTYSLQIAPDEKIYVTKSYNQFLGVINSPDFPGLSCNYVDQGFDLDPNQMGYTSAIGLPTFMQSYLKGHVSCVNTDGVEDPAAETENKIYPNPSDGNIHLLIGAGKTTVCVFDLLGKNVFNETFSQAVPATQAIQLHTEPGMYFVKVNNGRNQSVQRIEVY